MRYVCFETSFPLARADRRKVKLTMWVCLDVPVEGEGALAEELFAPG